MQIKDIEIYITKINKDITINELKSYLNINIISHCLNYKNDKKRYDSLYGFCLLRKAYLKYGIDINNLILKTNVKGKAFFDNLHFNISNSLNYIAIAISQKEVGIDIEFLYNIKENKKYETLILSSNELEEFNNSLDKRKYLLTIWSIKESYYKFLGEGIDFEKLKKDHKTPSILKFYEFNKDLACISVFSEYKVNENDIVLNYNI